MNEFYFFNIYLETRTNGYYFLNLEVKAMQIYST